ncbi:MAG: sulfite oxidase heme-binding subunit YedZ [Chloroflexota bacterium]
MASSVRTQSIPRPTPSGGGRGRPWLKPGIFLGGLAPLASLTLRGVQGHLGADPIAVIENETGLVALIFLTASLACTPARYVFGWTWQMATRRDLGLFAFFYASVHFLTYLVLDQVFDWSVIVEDVIQRPFITVGVLALLLMAPLALTSTNAWVRKLGFRRWQILHRLAYVAGILAVVHFILRVKVDLTQPLTYAVVVGGLLALRAAFWIRKRRLATAVGQTRKAPVRV